MVQHISAEEMDESKDENAQHPIEHSVFDRLQPSTSTKRTSVFIRIWGDQNSKSSVFWRVKNRAQARLRCSIESRKLENHRIHYPKSKGARCSIDSVMETKCNALSRLA